MRTQTQTLTADLPTPSKRHATCPWCGHAFEGIVVLIDHVDREHVADWDQAISA